MTERVRFAGSFDKDRAKRERRYFYQPPLRPTFAPPNYRGRVLEQVALTRRTMKKAEWQYGNVNGHWY